MASLFTALLCQLLMDLNRELPSACPQPPKLNLEIDKTVVEQFEPLTFNWESESSEQCVSAGDWAGNRPLQGPLTTTFRTAGEKEVTFKCTGSGGSVSRAVQFTVLDSPIETGEASLENGASLFADTESNSVFHIPVLNHYSYRKHLGTIYENSSTGETTDVAPGFYGDLSLDCEIADLNGDAFPDAIMSSMTTWYANSFAKEEDIINPERRPRLHFLINTGEGYFESGEHLLPGSEHFRINIYKDLHVADLNGDGLDDILASSEGGGDSMLRDDGILLLMSQPDGSYADATHNMDYVRTPVDRGEFTEEVFQIQAGVFLPFDLNGDGQKDLFINGMGTGVQYGLPSVFLNDGDGTFTPWSKYDEDEQRDLWGFTDWLMWRGGEVTDFDLDGDDDIVLFCYKGCFRQGSEASIDDQGNGLVLINENGDLSLDNAIHFPVGLFGSNTKNDAVDVGDVNGDGYPDIVTASGKSEPYYINRKIQILINQNGERLEDQTALRIDNALTDANGHAEGVLHLIDYDQDGDLDIFDFQKNVSDGVSSWAMEYTEAERTFPYFSNGGALFLNDGQGHFSAVTDDLHNPLTLRAIDWPEMNQASYALNKLYNPWTACPIDFGGEYGIGFIHGTVGAWADVFDDPDPEDGQGASIATVREIRASDQNLLSN